MVSHLHDRFLEACTSLAQSLTACSTASNLKGHHRGVYIVVGTVNQCCLLLLHIVTAVVVAVAAERVVLAVAVVCKHEP